MKKKHLFITMALVFSLLFNLVAFAGETSEFDAERFQVWKEAQNLKSEAENFLDIEEGDVTGVKISDISINMGESSALIQPTGSTMRPTIDYMQNYEAVTYNVTGVIEDSGIHQEYAIDSQDLNADIDYSNYEPTDETDTIDIPIAITPLAANTSTKIDSLNASSAYVNPSTGNFRAGQTACFLFKVQNYGTTTSTNIQMAIYLDNYYLGTANLGNMTAGSYFTGEMELDGVQVGTHNVKLTLDNNQTINKNFYWEEYGYPNLISEITNDPYSYGVKATQNVFYKFNIYNIGYASTTKTIPCEIYVGQSRLGSVSLPGGLPAGGSAEGSFTLNFGGNTGIYSIDLKVDPGNTIQETAKYDNNSYTYTYSVGMHPAGNRLQRTDNSAVFVDSAVKRLYGAVNYERAKDWNNITRHVRVNNVTHGDIASGQNVRVKLAELGLGDRGVTLQDTYYDPNEYVIIQLNSNTAAFSNLTTAVERTLVHELGHVFQLAHPSDYGYNNQVSIMHPYVSSYASDTITFTDEFNLIDAHAFKDKLY